MTATAGTLDAAPRTADVNGALGGETAWLISADGQGRGGPRRSPAISDAPAPGWDRSSPLGSGRVRAVRSWPLFVLAPPAVVAVWSGWVGIGQMTGFGQVHPLPGLWDSLHVNTATRGPRLGANPTATCGTRTPPCVSARSTWAKAAPMPRIRTGRQDTAVVMPHGARAVWPARGGGRPPARPCPAGEIRSRRWADGTPSAVNRLASRERPCGFPGLRDPRRRPATPATQGARLLWPHELR